MASNLKMEHFSILVKGTTVDRMEKLDRSLEFQKMERNMNGVIVFFYHKESSSLRISNHNHSFSFVEQNFT